MKLKLTPQLQKHLKTLLILGGITGALLISQPFAWRWLRSLAQDLNDERTQAQQIAELERRSAALDVSVKQANTLFDQLAVVVPPKHEVPQVVERLERVAAERGIYIEITSITEEAPLGQELQVRDSIAPPAQGPAAPATTQAPATQQKATIVPLAVRLTVIGPPVNLLSFIDAVEHIQEITKVRSWQLQSSVAQPHNATITIDPSFYSLNMTIIFYLQQTPSNG